MKMALSCAVLAAGVLTASSAFAQGTLPLSLEVRGGLGIKTGEFHERDGEIRTASGGVGFGANAAFDFIPGVAVYAGYDHYSFNATIAGVDAEYVDKGFVVGARIAPAVGTLRGFDPWARAGAIFRDLDLTNDALESERATGIEVGAGIDIPLGQVLSFTPGVLFRAYNPKFGEAENEGEGRVRYFDLSLGMRARL